MRKIGDHRLIRVHISMQTLRESLHFYVPYSSSAEGSVTNPMQIVQKGIFNVFLPAVLRIRSDEGV